MTAATDRRTFLTGATAFALAPAFAANGRPLRTPLMLDTKRMAIHDGPGMRTTAVILRNLERLVAAQAKLEVRCLVVPKLTDGADLANRHRHLASLGIGDGQIVDLEYHDYARSKYLALGMRDTMP